jgi:hypothetical protein
MGLLIGLLLALTLAACGGESTPEPAEEAEPTVASEPTPAATATEPEPEMEATEEPTPPPSPTLTPTVAPTPTGDPEAAGAETPVEVSGVEARSVLDVASIERFRIRLDFTMAGEAYPERAMNGTIEGAFTTDPRANHLVIQAEGETELSGTFEIIQIEDQIYLKAAGQWIEAPAGTAPQLEDYYLFGDELEAEETVSGLERVGEETVNGRETIHYRGDEAFLTANEVSGAAFDVENAETARYDVWIDKAEGFPVKQTVVFDGPGVNPQNPEATGRIEYVLEYYDFNAEDITIEAPEAIDVGGG